MLNIIFKYFSATFFSLFLIYLFLLFSWPRLQTDMTFPGGGKQKLEMTGIEHFLLRDSEGDDISVVHYDQKSEKTVLYFHGNGGNLNKFAGELQYIADLGYNVVAYDYPGYGESTGEPTEAKTYEFSERAYDYLTREKRIAPGNIILWGYSLGTAVAIDLAIKKQVGSLVLVAPLTSLYDMGTKAFWFPIQRYLFIPNGFDSISKASKIGIPTLVIHGDDDSVVPYSMWKMIYEALGSKNKHFVTIPHGGHQHVLEKYGEDLKGAFLSFLNEDIAKN